MKTIKRYLTLLLFACIQPLLFAQDLSINYFGQKTPGETSVKFAPGIISLPGKTEVNPYFSPNGKEFYFTIMDDLYWSSITTMVCKYTNGKWTAPANAGISVHKFDWSCIISADGNTMLHSSAGNDWIYKIYVRKRTKNGWSNAVSISNEINSQGSNLITSISADGTIYFRSTRNDGNSDIYYAKSKNGTYNQVVKMESNINTSAWESHPTIAPDGSYLIFYRGVESPQADILISFKKEDNSWSKATSMGLSIHSGQPGCSSITPDGKYLLYQAKDKDIYWVNLEEKVKSLRRLVLSSSIKKKG